MKLNEIIEGKSIVFSRVFGCERSDCLWVIGPKLRPLAKVHRSIFVPQVTERGIGHQPMFVPFEEASVFLALESPCVLSRVDLCEKGGLSRHHRLIIHRRKRIQ